MDWDYRSAISTLREEQNLTQRQLAQLVGVTETTIANWEKGRSGLEWFDRLIRLCSALRCKPEDLIRYIPHEKQEASDEKELGSFSEMIKLIGRTSQSEVVDFSEADIKRIEQDGGGKFSDIVKLYEAHKKAREKQYPFPPDMISVGGPNR